MQSHPKPSSRLTVSLRVLIIVGLVVVASVTAVFFLQSGTAAQTRGGASTQSAEINAETTITSFTGTVCNFVCPIEDGSPCCP